MNKSHYDIMKALILQNVEAFEIIIPFVNNDKMKLHLRDLCKHNKAAIKEFDRLKDLGKLKGELKINVYEKISDMKSPPFDCLFKEDDINIELTPENHFEILRLEERLYGEEENKDD